MITSRDRQSRGALDTYGGTLTCLIIPILIYMPTTATPASGAWSIRLRQLNPTMAVSPSFARMLLQRKWCDVNANQCNVSQLDSAWSSAWVWCISKPRLALPRKNRPPFWSHHWKIKPQLAVRTHRFLLGLSSWLPHCCRLCPISWLDVLIVLIRKLTGSRYNSLRCASATKTSFDPHPPVHSWIFVLFHSRLSFLPVARSTDTTATVMRIAIAGL